MKLEAILIASSSPIEPDAPHADEIIGPSRAHPLIEDTDRTQLLSTVKSICKADGTFALTIIENLNNDPDELVNTVKSISKLDRSFRLTLMEGLIFPASDAAGPVDSIRSSDTKRKALSDVDLNTMGSGPISKKLKAAPVEVKHALCTQCGEVFSSAENEEDACTRHDGSLEVDDDKYDWPDYDENCHGEIDSYDMQVECPQHFIWSCCDEDGGATEGCTRGPHTSGGRKSEYAKLRLLGLKTRRTT